MKIFLATLIIAASVVSSLSIATERHLEPTNLKEALMEIETMPLDVCRGALILNQRFYQETERLSGAERRDYFERFRQEVINAGFPSPRPPPRPGSAIDLALNTRCGPATN